MIKLPSLTVGALIVNKEGKILVLKSKKWHGKYIFPCGHVDFGETLQDALKREVKEETALDIKNIGLLRAGETIKSSEFHDADRHFVSLNYLCKTNQGKVRLNHEAQEYLWVFPQKALKLNLDLLTRQAIKKIFKRIL